MSSHNASLYSSFNQARLDCYFYETYPYIVPPFTVVWTFVLFPLCFLVLNTGLRQWRENKRSTVSHTDFFMYNALFLELIQYCGYVVITIGCLRSINKLIDCGLIILYFIFPGLMSFHMLVCIERYLAVVYPVFYLSLRKERGFRLRKCLVVTVWVISAGWVLIMSHIQHIYIPLLLWLVTVTCLIFFCSVQVLCALRNPSPGEGGGVSRAKRRAFNTICVILSALLLWLGEAIFRTVIEKSNLLDREVICLLEQATCWYKIPCSLLLPMLFLHRAGILPKCRAKKTTGTALRNMSKK